MKGWILFGFSTTVGSPEQHIPISMCSFSLTHPAKFSCEAETGVSRKKHDLYFFHIKAVLKSRLFIYLFI